MKFEYVLYWLVIAIGLAMISCEKVDQLTHDHSAEQSATTPAHQEPEQQVSSDQVIS